MAQTNYLNKSVEEAEEGKILSKRTAVDLTPPKRKLLKTAAVFGFFFILVSLKVLQYCKDMQNIFRTTL